MSTFTDPYASARETTEGRVYSVTGGDWDSLVTEIGKTVYYIFSNLMKELDGITKKNMI